MKKAFQITLVVSNMVPLLTGILALTSGASLFVSDDVITADFDAQIRVYGVWFTAIFFLSVWIAFNIETGGTVLKIVFILMAVAGVSRIYSMVSLGSYPVTTAIAAAVEIATLAFIPWHNYLVKKL